MSLIVPDFYQVVQVWQGVKTTHRWPAGTRPDGFLCSPKMVPGTEHQVYEHARHGRYGNRNSPPLLMVLIEDLQPGWPMQWEDEDIVSEGFTDLEAYGLWWDRFRAGNHLCKLWVEMQQEPFWVATFKCVGKTPFYQYRFDDWWANVKAY